MKAFLLILLSKIAKFLKVERRAVKTLMLVAYPPPVKGSVYGMAWEWTVIFDLGVWRCLDKNADTVPRFFVVLTDHRESGYSLSGHYEIFY